MKPVGYKTTERTESGRKTEGVIVFCHPKGRFYTVEFTTPKGKFRECYTDVRYEK